MYSSPAITEEIAVVGMIYFGMWINNLSRSKINRTFSNFHDSISSP